MGQMTPKEKAKELVCKMYGCEINTDLNDIYILNGDGYFLAINSALTALDEILNNIMFFWYNPTKDMPKDFIYFTTQKKYWEQVKEEIEKL
jgi:hypothetical protein